MECPDADTPPAFSAIDPDTLDVIAQAEGGKFVFSRLIVGKHGGEGFANMQGSLGVFLFRNRRDGA